MNTVNFSLQEILSLIGLVQCTYLFVHIFFIRGQIKAAAIPVLYFIVLGAAFFLDFSERQIGQSDAYWFYQWAAWFFGPPLSVLLVIQLSDMTKLPALKDFWVVLLIPICFLLSSIAVNNGGSCELFEPCSELKAMLTVTGYMAGAISLLVIFSKKDLFTNVRRQKLGQERYWLILTLIFMNLFFLTAMMAELTDAISADQSLMLRTILGLGFVYLVSTSLLRLYKKKPAGLAKGSDISALSESEVVIANRVNDLMKLEKVYQEPTYSRADLARECGVAETTISKIINNYFHKSFPQLLNELRVEDAKQLLLETDAPVSVVCEEVGFNSLPSFNRVFKDLTGYAPSAYRKSLKS